ncbi:MAG: recombination regulator RecX [Micrococcales bacterium]|nr:recombination regulator RecX [Micrococcales bacterium]
MLSPSEAEELARSIGLRLLTAAPRSRAQLEQAMAKRLVPPQVIDKVLDRFVEVGLVDDQAYAEMLVRTRHSERGLTGPALAAELRRRGIDDQVAASAMEQISAEGQTERAEALALKKLSSTRGLDYQVRLRRTVSLLTRKGYSSGQALEITRRLLDQEEAEPTSTW